MGGGGGGGGGWGGGGGGGRARAGMGEEAHVAELSRRMLGGWRLLSDTCPLAECDVPLVQPPGGGARLCVRCGGQYDAELAPLSEVAPGGAPGAPSPPRGDAAAPAGAGGAGGGEDVRADLARFGPFAVRGAEPPSPGPGGGPEVAADESQIETLRSPGLPRPPTPVLDAVDAEPAPPPPSAPSPGKERRRRSDEASKKIAEYLLQGWALLDDYCPMAGCNCPLVRNRDGQRRCVSCDMWVMAAGQTPPPPPQLEQPGPPLPAAGSPLSRLSPGRQPGESVLAQSPGVPPPGSGAWTGSAHGAPPGADETAAFGTPDPPMEALPATIRVLLSRIRGAGEALQAPGLSPAEAGEWVALITDCAAAVKALEELQRLGVSQGPGAARE